MAKLFDYFGKDIIIIDTDGNKWQGHAAAYTPAIDSENGEEEIAIQTKAGLIGFSSPDIIKIECTDAIIQNASYHFHPA